MIRFSTASVIMPTPPTLNFAALFSIAPFAMVFDRTRWNAMSKLARREVRKKIFSKPPKRFLTGAAGPDLKASGLLTTPPAAGVALENKWTRMPLAKAEPTMRPRPSAWKRSPVVLAAEAPTFELFDFGKSNQRF
jgi:hypothetical protein